MVFNHGDIAFSRSLTVLCFVLGSMAVTSACSAEVRVFFSLFSLPSLSCLILDLDLDRERDSWALNFDFLIRRTSF